jgi:hypothetical protein
MRVHAATGHAGPAVYLSRMPPEVRADGGLRLEPGGVLLGFPAPHGWDYVGFFFPAGLDLDALLHDPRHRATPESLSPIPAPARERLEPVIALDAFGAPGVRSVICRARGAAGPAVEQAALALEGEGWSRLSRRTAPAPGEAWALSSRRGGRGGELWIETPERSREGGLVTIWIAAD